MSAIKAMPLNGYCWVMPRQNDVIPMLVLGGTFACDRNGTDGKMVRWADQISVMDRLEGNRDKFIGYPKDAADGVKLLWLSGKGYRRVRAQIAATEGDDQ